MLVFSKKKMMERLTNEGRAEEVTPDLEAIMDALDGKEAIASCWRRVVYNESVYYVRIDEGTGEYVNENDCISFTEWKKEH